MNVRGSRVTGPGGRQREDRAEYQAEVRQLLERLDALAGARVDDSLGASHCRTERTRPIPVAR